MSANRNTSMPNWVKGFLGAGLLAVVIVGALLATGHGPWEHMQMSGMH